MDSHTKTRGALKLPPTGGSLPDPRETRRPRVVVGHVAHPDALALLRTQCDVVGGARGPLTGPELVRELRDADALLAFMGQRVDARVLDQAPRLRVVAGAFKGADGIDVAACTARGIWVTAVPDALTAATAELAVGLLLAAARRLREGDQAVRAGDFQGWRSPWLPGLGLEGTPIGIVGMGAVGRAIAQRLAPFGCDLAYSDPTVERAEGVTAMPLDDLLARSSAVVLAVPLTDSTRHLIDARALALLPPEALLVNVGRGSTVDEHAVAAALDQGRLAAYSADVFAFEDEGSAPGIPEPIRTHPRGVLTPHAGTATPAVRARIETDAARSILTALSGRAPHHALNRPECVTPTK